MGFTIDMITGNISNITNGTNVIESDNDSSVSTSVENDHFDSLPHEQLLPVSDAYIVPEADTYSIPGSLIDSEIDTFIEDMSR